MIENMCSTHTKGPQACPLRILALALTLFVGASPLAGATTFTVTDTADTLSAGSLREAVMAANVTPGADVINLPAGTYLLAIIGTDDGAAAGDLDITDDLTISGAGAATTIVDANEIDRVFHVIDANVTFSDVTISNGMAIGSGGGIRNDGGAVELINSTVSGNTTAEDGAYDGGGIFNRSGGTVTLINSIVSGNTAADPGGLTNFGGGIFNNNGGTLTLTNSTVSGNTVADQGGGMRNGEGSTVTLTNSTITANTAGARGGGIRNLGTVNFQNTIIAGNEAGTGRDCSSSTSTGGTLTSLGDNLVGAGTGCPSSAMGDQTVGSTVP